MIIAAKQMELIETLFLCVRIATIMQHDIIVALIAEIDIPVMKRKNKTAMAEMQILRKRIPIKSIGRSINDKIARIMPICRPLMARMWAIPALENICRVSSSIKFASPITAVQISCLVLGCNEEFKIRFITLRCRHRDVMKISSLWPITL